MLAVREELGTLLAADATTLAPATNANKLALITSAFTPVETLVAASLTYAAGNGLDPILGVTGAQSSGLDPTSNQQEIIINPPAGGYKWLTSGSFAGPITLYGVALLNNGLTVLLAVEAFPAPITVTAAGQIVDADPVKITFVLSPMS